MSKEVFFSVQGPLDVVPSAAQTRASMLAGFSGFVHTLNGNPRKILEQHGLDANALRDPELHIDVRALVAMVENCASLFGDPLFGLRLAERQTPDLFGCVTVLSRSAPTIRGAITLLCEYLPAVYSPGSMMEFVVGTQTAELRYTASTNFGTSNQSNYQAVFLLMRLLQQIGGPNLQISYVNLSAAARSKDIPEAERLLGCRFHRASINAIAFPARMLDHPAAGCDRVVYRLLGGYLHRVKTASRTNLVARVDDYIRAALSSGICTIGRCARQLGISERTLQLHLSDRGIRFSEIMDQQRCELAKSYLEQPGLSLGEITHRLGYSEQSAFGRAFKRWTGSTPQTYQTQAAKRRENSLAA